MMARESVTVMQVVQLSLMSSFLFCPSLSRSLLLFFLFTLSFLILLGERHLDRGNYRQARDSTALADSVSAKLDHDCDLIRYYPLVSCLPSVARDAPPPPVSV